MSQLLEKGWSSMPAWNSCYTVIAIIRISWPNRLPIIESSTTTYKPTIYKKVVLIKNPIPKNTALCICQSRNKKKYESSSRQFAFKQVGRPPSPTPPRQHSSTLLPLYPCSLTTQPSDHPIPKAHFRRPSLGTTIPPPLGNQQTQPSL